MHSVKLPDRPRMMTAFMERDGAFDGVFVTAVRTTGIFCRPTCPARKPKPENVEFFPGARDALGAGYRPCLRCRPLATVGSPPGWLAPLVRSVEAEPQRRWTDASLRALGLNPVRVRRWFKTQHGMTFHDYARARRIGCAVDALRNGAPVTRTAFDSGYDSLSGFATAFREVTGRAPSEVRGRATVHLDRLATPLGPMLAAADDDGLVLLEFADRRMLETQLGRVRNRFGDPILVWGANAHVRSISDELSEYFRGERTRFDTPLVLRGTPFQEAVWRSLLEIPAGRTRSYADVARAVGRPRAVRAVARANGDNRLAIVVPCHRVVGSDGRLTGYGGGLWRKRRLLDLELQPALAL